MEEGTAEIFGAELTLGAPRPVPGGCPFAVFTWEGAVVSLTPGLPPGADPAATPPTPWTAAVRLAYEGKLLRTLGNTLALVVNPLRPKDKRKALPPEMMSEMRFGPAIFAGTLAAALVNWGAP